MRLIHIHIISEYKNLKDFKVDFDGQSFIDVFVGKNGAGKSNFFEALIEIFRHLFEKEHFMTFDYLMRYELDGKESEISWRKEKLFLNGKETKSIPKNVLPNNILIYYSGHNSKVTDLVKEYEESFKKELKEANEGDTREFIGIGKDYKSILLSVLLLQPDGNKAKEFIKYKLGITSIGDQLKITLRRPYYARKRGYEIDPAVKETSFWKAVGITRKFLDALSTVKPGGSTRSREEGYFTRDEEFADEYILYFDIASFRDIFKNLTGQELFREFDNLKTIEMLHAISIDIKLGDKEATIDHFSDGQFQSVYIYSIVELFKDRNCITLLDEPDSFLHPEWQYGFIKQVVEIAEKASEKNHLLLSTHSPSTIASLTQSHLNIFEISNNKVATSKWSKADIIKSLSAGLISLTEGEARLNIGHFLNNTSGAVLFTEGITDEMILETAWTRLYPKDKRNFEIQNAFSCGFLRNLIKDKTLYENFPKRKFFALFDFDEAFGDWNQLGVDIETDPFKCLTKKYGEFDSYSLLLPVSKNTDVTKQVINPRTGKNYGNKSLQTIELLFYGIPGLEEYFIVDNDRTDGFIKFIGDGSKVKFAKDVVPQLDPKYFEAFKPIFEFLKSKC